MPTTRAHRTIPATQDELWATVRDPNHQPHWWPRVERVEAVAGGHFTQVLKSDRGRSVRADFRMGRTDKPTVVTWEQLVQDTPFEKVLQHSQTEVRLEPEAGGATRVTLEQRAKLRGLSRLGGFLVRRATRTQLREALDGLERLHG